MIVTKPDKLLRIVTQPDHARTASELLSLWRAGGLPAHPRRVDLLFAVREHDNGWRETDAAPRADPATGRPYTFLDLPDEFRRDLWHRGALRYADERPGAAALITRHALSLHADRRSNPDWAPLLAALDERLTEQLEAAHLDPHDLESDYRWLALADAISLRACGALDDRFESAGTRIERQGDNLAIHPFPLAGATTFAIPCRSIPDRTYESDTDLAVELASAKWTNFRVRILPLA